MTSRTTKLRLEFKEGARELALARQRLLEVLAGTGDY